MQILKTHVGTLNTSYADGHVLFGGCIGYIRAVEGMFTSLLQKGLFCRQLQAIRSAGTFFQTSSGETFYWPMIRVADRRNPDKSKHLGTCIFGDAHITT